MSRPAGPHMNSRKVLIIEDDPDIAGLLGLHLAEQIGRRDHAVLDDLVQTRSELAPGQRHEQRRIADDEDRTDVGNRVGPAAPRRQLDEI